MSSIPAGLGPVIVGPVRPRPCATWRAINAAIEFAGFDALHPGILGGGIHKIMLRASHQDVHFVEHESNTASFAQFAQTVANTGFALDAGEEVGNVQSPLAAPG